MVGLILVAHGDLATSLLETAALIAGEPERAEAISFGMDESPEDLHRKLTDALDRMGGKVVLLADLPGGTPSNVCARLAIERGCQVVAGANLPMLLEVLLSREDEDPRSVARTALEAGRDGLVHVSELLRG